MATEMMTKKSAAKKDKPRSGAKPISKAMLQRVETFRANPPSADWDGAWRLDQK